MEALGHGFKTLHDTGMGLNSELSQGLEKPVRVKLSRIIEAVFPPVPQDY